MMNLDDDRQRLALRMVQVLPSFGAWASSIRDFETPLGRIGLRQLSILYVMRYPKAGQERPTPGDLAQAFNVQPSVITRALARLEANGFVERVADASDRRIARLSITEAGREISVYVERLFVDEMATCTAFLSETQVADLAQWIEVLSDIREDLTSHKHSGKSRIAAFAVKDGESDDE